MSQIVKQCAEPHDPAPPIEISAVQVEAGSEHWLSAAAELIEQLGCHMHDTERVLEPRMHGTGEDRVRPAELADPPEALEGRVLDDLPLLRPDLHETVDRTGDLQRLIGHAESYQR